MNILGSCMLLFVPPASVSAAEAEESFWTNPCVCYILDGILISYCIIATGLFFREKFSSIPSAAEEVVGTDNGIYQELTGPKDADPYQVLEPSNRKMKPAKKKSSQSGQAGEGDLHEMFIPSSLPLPPQ
ncbi:T-cell surface glycoprotein CD3 zeta chain-like [Aulostomus maculatus]